ncbi:MAG: SDR family oxidoreductase [Thermoplasmatota archaeon]
MDNLFITGCSSGVGNMLAKNLCEDYHVIAVARRIEKMKKEFEDIDNISTYKIDLEDISLTKKVVEEIIQEHGYIPYLINNAGVNIKENVENLTENQLMKSFKVNVVSPLIIMKKFLLTMKQNNFGRIINITSGAPLNNMQGYGAYSASKAALNSITVTASKEYNDHNIKINLMSPGPVKTEMAPNSDKDPSICLPTVRYLLNLGKTGPSGKFFWLGYEVPLYPDLKGVDWLKGKPSENMRRIL